MARTLNASLQMAPHVDLSPSVILRGLIASEREYGRAFGVLAEACRKELAKRGELNTA